MRRSSNLSKRQRCAIMSGALICLIIVVGASICYTAYVAVSLLLEFLGFNVEDEDPSESWW